MKIIRVLDKNIEFDTFFARKRKDANYIDDNSIYEDAIRFHEGLIDEYEDDEDN